MHADVREGRSSTPPAGGGRGRYALGAAVIGTALLVVVPAVPAGAQAYSCTHDPVTDQVVCEVREDGGSSRGEPGDGAGSGRDGGEVHITWPPPGMVVVEYPLLRRLPGGGACVGTGVRVIEARFAGPIERGRQARFEHDLARYLEEGNPPPPPCPSAATPDPEELRAAVAAVVAHQLPRPVATIAPGWAITGLPAYLETGRALSFSTGPITVPLSSGPASVVLEGAATYDVDWGDGRTDRGLTDPGGPWPHGAVTHTYLDRAQVEVQVTDRWRITFRVAGLAEQQLTLEITGEPLELEVIEVRALRTTAPR